jgi:medium-chain acyl-[acyl-carrier-protein] hydrolase
MTMPARTKWLAPYYRQNSYATLRLFCFPYAGGGASLFARWSALLPAHIELCPVQAPGRENRFDEDCFASVSDLVDSACDGLAPYFDTPFAFFGHSLGALIAYELAQKLRRLGKGQPKHLIASAHRAPQVPLPDEPTWHLPYAEFKRRLQELNGTPKEVFQDEELLKLVLPLVRADFRLDETYSHPDSHPRLDTPITVLAGKQDGEISESDLRAWSMVTKGQFNLSIVEGDHFFILSHTAKVVKLVSQILLRT